MTHSRYPALPALADRLAADALVFLDDADREPEREIVARWAEEVPDWRSASTPRSAWPSASRS